MLDRQEKQRSTPTVVPGAALPWQVLGRVGGLVPLKGFHCGSIINWLSKYDLKRFAGRFPSYMGLIWFSLGLGGEILRTWKGNTISDPLPLISSEKMMVSET